MRSIDEGLYGTAMPGWKTRLSDRERRDVVAYIKTFSSFFRRYESASKALAFAARRAAARRRTESRAAILRFDRLPKCHGDQGRGDGPRHPRSRTMRSSDLAANLHENWRFNGGGRWRTSTTGCARASTARRCRRSAISWSRSSHRRAAVRIASTCAACRRMSRPS